MQYNKPITKAKSASSPHIIQIYKLINSVKEVMNEVTFYITEHKPITEQELVLLQAGLEEIINKYNQAFKAIAQNQLYDHLMIKGLYKSTIKQQQQFFIALNANLLESQLAESSNFVTVIYPSYLQQICNSLTPYGDTAVITMCYQKAIQLPRSMLFQREVGPYIKLLSEAMSILTLMINEQMQDNDIDTVTTELSNMISYYRQIMIAINRLNLNDHPCTKDFFQVVQYGHEDFFYCLLASLEDVEMTQHQNFFINTLPSLFEQLVSVLEFMKIDTTTIKRFWLRTRQISTHFFSFKLLQDLHASTGQYSVQVKNTAKTREQMFANFQQLFSAILPRYLQLLKNAPELAVEYTVRGELPYTDTCLQAVYAEARFLKQKLNWLNLDCQEITRIASFYSQGADISSLIKFMISPFIEEIRRVKEQIALIDAANQTVAHILHELTMAADKTVSHLQNRFLSTLMEYQTAVRQSKLSIEQLMANGLRMLDEQGFVFKSLLDYIEKPEMDLVSRLTVCVNFQAWLVKQKNKPRFASIQSIIKPVIQTLEAHIKLYRYADDFIKQAKNATVISKEKALPINDHQQLRKKFVMAVQTNTGELLAKCLILVRAVTQFDEHTQLALGKIFAFLQQALQPPFMGENKEKLAELVSQIQPLFSQRQTLNKAKPQVAGSSQTHSIEQQPIAAKPQVYWDTWNNSFAFFQQVQTSANFSYFSTPIEQQIVRAANVTTGDEAFQQLLDYQF